MGYVVGVDLGTTWTAAAVASATAPPAVVGLGGRGTAIPTVVARGDDGGLLVGDAALRRGVESPELLARHFKRLVGDTVPVLVGGQPWSPEALLVEVLSAVLAKVEERQGEAPTAIAVTHPANWGAFRRDLLEQAMAHVGIAARMVSEPEAAATFYAGRDLVPPGTAVAVYDLGGGTFDAAVLRRSATGFDLLGRPEGVERMGGLDIDAAVFGHVVAALPPEAATDDDAPVELVARARLRDDCIVAKEALSEDTSVAIPVHLPGWSGAVRLTRAELEAMARPLVVRSIDALERALQGAGLPTSDVDRIVLAGGASRMPLIAQLLTERLRRPLALDAHPKEVVALGAAQIALAAPQPLQDPPPPSPPAPEVPLVTPPPTAGPAAVGPSPPPPGHAVARAPGEPSVRASPFFDRPVWSDWLAWVVAASLVAGPLVGAVVATPASETRLIPAAVGLFWAAVGSLVAVVVRRRLRGPAPTDASPRSARGVALLAGSALLLGAASLGAVSLYEDRVDRVAGMPFDELEGQWTVAGPATECAGFDGCDQLAVGAAEPVDVSCTISGCTLSLRDADPELLEESSGASSASAAGDLATGGFTCDGEGRPTVWSVEIGGSSPTALTDVRIEMSADSVSCGELHLVIDGSGTRR